MAVLKNIVLAASVLATVMAVPLAPMHRRDMSTATVTEWVTVNAQAVVWVDDSGKPVKTDLPTVAGAVNAKPTSASSSAPVTVVSPSTPPPPPPAAAPVTTSSAVSSPTYSPAAFAQISSAPAPPAPAPVAPSSVAPAAPSSAPAPAPLVQGKSTGGPCEGAGSGCSGDITHYDGGLGACGWNVNTASDFQIALPFALMGTQSNGNPYCGRSLTITGPAGNQVQATVGDKCMGCTGYSIDLTNALFSAVAPNGDGRVGGISWYFN